MANDDSSERKIWSEVRYLDVDGEQVPVTFSNEPPPGIPRRIYFFARPPVSSRDAVGLADHIGDLRNVLRQADRAAEAGRADRVGQREISRARTRGPMAPRAPSRPERLERPTDRSSRSSVPASSTTTGLMAGVRADGWTRGSSDRTISCDISTALSALRRASGPPHSLRARGQRCRRVGSVNVLLTGFFENRCCPGPDETCKGMKG
jgi:hypothetical protein